MDSIDLLGLAAGFLTTLSFVPQALKIHRTKSAKDISLWMFIAFTIGITAWLLFGILKHEVSIALWNGVTLALSLWILAMKLRFDRVRP